MELEITEKVAVGSLMDDGEFPLPRCSFLLHFRSLTIQPPPNPYN